MQVITRVNGEERQNDTTERLMFPFGRILEYISTFCTLSRAISS
jgi:2-keto-4-pentenoate hydratase/2-oxohepta-3-ene-1,7-dioic acid hydratase in catechol pathway